MGEARDLGAEEIKESFSAFKTRLVQGRDLKQLRRDAGDAASRLKQMRAEYEDRRDIFEHFEQIVAAQRDIAQGNARVIESTHESIARIDADAQRLEAKLSVMQKEHAQALQPESDELYGRNSAFAQAKASAKSAEAARGEARRAARDEQAGVLEREALEQAESNLARAQQEVQDAKAAQREAQRAYDAKRKAHEREERAVSDEMARLKKQRKDLLADIEGMDRKVEAANERIAFCEGVVAQPQDTERLGRDIELLEQEERALHERIVELEAAHEHSRRSSSMARNIVVVVAAIVAIVAVSVIAHLVING